MSMRRVTVSGALLVCRWTTPGAGQRRLDAGGGGSLSRISPTMMTSGSARRKARMAEANRGRSWLHLHLAQTRLGDFHRISAVQIFHVDGIDGAERRVERGGLAGSGGPTHKTRP